MISYARGADAGAGAGVMAAILKTRITTKPGETRVREEEMTTRQKEARNDEILAALNWQAGLDNCQLT